MIFRKNALKLLKRAFGNWPAVVLTAWMYGCWFWSFDKWGTWKNFGSYFISCIPFFTLFPFSLSGSLHIIPPSLFPFPPFHSLIHLYFNRLLWSSGYLFIYFIYSPFFSPVGIQSYLHNFCLPLYLYNKPVRQIRQQERVSVNACNQIAWSHYRMWIC